VSNRVLDDLPDDLSGWTLAWSDEFDGPAGALPDPAAWAPQVGGHGWGNQELQFYTDGENASLDGTGSLAIVVRRSDPAGYTSASTPADLRDHRWVFDHEFILLVNVAVGGAASVDPDSSTVFPQRLLVDYVRVYAASGAPG
jgi:hypothetical protein